MCLRGICFQPTIYVDFSLACHGLQGVKVGSGIQSGSEGYRCSFEVVDEMLCPHPIKEPVNHRISRGLTPAPRGMNPVGSDLLLVRSRRASQLKHT
eukprot:1161206-Pelagomonas_calceolata.AAC.3